MRKWEYRVINSIFISTELLNKLGEEGWELLYSRDIKELSKSNRGESYEAKHQAIFKRQKLSEKVGKQQEREDEDIFKDFGI